VLLCLELVYVIPFGDCACSIQVFDSTIVKLAVGYSTAGQDSLVTAHAVPFDLSRAALDRRTECDWFHSLGGTSREALMACSWKVVQPAPFLCD
jgi:hypothetical protein